MNTSLPQAVAEASALARAGFLRGFGLARSIPKRDYALSELRLNKIEPTALLSPRDTTLESVRITASTLLLLGIAAAGKALGLDFAGYIEALVPIVFLVAVDEIGSAGAGQAIAIDALGRVLSPTYADRVAKVCPAAPLPPLAAAGDQLCPSPPIHTQRSMRLATSLSHICWECCQRGILFLPGMHAAPLQQRPAGRSAHETSRCARKPSLGASPLF